MAHAEKGDLQMTKCAYAAFISLYFLHTGAAAKPPAPSPVVLDDYGPCAQTSLYVICRLKGVSASFKVVGERLGPPVDATHTFVDLSRTARELGMHPVALKADLGALHKMPMPGIAQLRTSHGEPRPHFLVLLGCRADGVNVLDVPHPPRFVRWSYFEADWTGNLLVFGDSAAEAAVLQSQYSGIAWDCGGSLFQSLALGTLSVGGLVVSVSLLCWIKRRESPPVAWRAEEHAARSIAHVLARLRRTSIALVVRIGTEKRQRLRALAMVLAMVVGVLLASYCLRRVSTSAPLLAFANTDIDYGALPAGDHVVAVDFRNTSKRPVAISRARSDCACASVTAPVQVNPGDVDKLQAKVRVRPGARTIHVTVEADDPVGPQTIRLSWVGMPEPAAYPPTVTATDALWGRPYERSISIFYPDGPDIPVPSLKRFECDESGVDVQAVYNERAAFRTTSTLSPTTTLGELALRLSITSPSAARRVKATGQIVLEFATREVAVAVPIEVDFIGTIVATPNQVVFASGSEVPLRGGRIIALSNIAIDEVCIRRSPTWLRCNLADSADSKQLRIELLDNAPAGLNRDDIILGDVTDSNVEVAIPVHTYSVVGL